MFCKNCGQSIEEGHVFCGNCGAPVAVTQPVPGTEAVSGAEPTPGTEAVFGAEVRPPAAPSAPYAVGPPPPAAPRYGSGWQPPQDLGRPAPQGPGGRKSTGLVVGIVAAAVVVLAGIGAGVYFGFFHGDGKESAGTGGTVTSRTTVGGASTSTTEATGTSTASSDGTVTTVGGSNTTQTIPGLGTSTSGGGASGGRPTTTTTTTEDIHGSYLAISQALADELIFQDQRIPQLATEINNTLPRVPEWVTDELSTMLDILSDLDWELADLPGVPAEYKASHSWLEDAVGHMVARIQATVLGIEAARNSGSASAATSYFDTGRKERDAYRQALEKYLAALPPD